MPRDLTPLKWIGLLIVLSCFCSTVHTEETVDLEGQVVDHLTGQSVEYVDVRLAGTMRGTSTDEHGRFSLSVQPGQQILQFSRIGYRVATRTVHASSYTRTALRVELVAQALMMKGIDVFSQTTGTRFEQLHESAGTLSGEDLERNYSLTLAETIKNEVGVGIRSMGPAPARPVIRGLSGDRVQITQDGIQARDLSSTSPDHAVTLEMYNLERIEIIRGPKTLLHSSSAAGGVINVVKNRILDSRPAQVFGSLGLRGTSVDRGALSAASMIAPVGPLGLFGEATYRTTSDQATPSGKLDNTEVNTRTFAVGLSRAGDRGYVGASYDQFDTEYGIPGGFIGGHPNGADIDIVRRVLDAKASYRFEDSKLNRLDASFVRTFYHHFEFESNGNIGAEFLFYDHIGDVKLHLGSDDDRSRTILSAGLSHHDLKLGAFVFTPPTTRLSGTLSAYHEMSRDRFELQVAGRYTYAALDPRDAARARVYSDDLDRTFHAWSAAISPLISLSDQLVGGFSISQSERIPTIEELYNEGPHLAAYTFEIGDATLDAERGIGLKAFLHFRKPDFDLLATGFWNEYGNYLTARNTGEINFAQLLPIYAIDGVEARFLGLESRLGIRSGERVLAEVGVSYVRGENRDDDLPLPEIPPLKTTGLVEYRHPWLTIGARAEIAGRQGRVDTNETPTDDYAVFGLYAQKDFDTAHLHHTLTLTLDNLADTEYRNHLSRIRSVMPEAGRSLRLNYRINYF